jgi:hypothetical protein
VLDEKRSGGVLVYWSMMDWRGGIVYGI